MMENILLDGLIGRGEAGLSKDIYKVSGCHCRQGVAAFNPIAPSQFERRIHTSCHMRGVRSATKLKHLQAATCKHREYCHIGRGRRLTWTHKMDIF